MERQEIFEVVRSLVAEKTGADPSTLTPGMTQKDIGLDSIHMVDLMMDAEERLGVRLEIAKLPQNPTLGDVVDVIEANIRPAG